MFKTYFERLVLLGVIEIENDPECGSPSFAQPRPKKRVNFLSEFINLNKQLKLKQYTMQNINEILLK